MEGQKTEGHTLARKSTKKTGKKSTPKKGTSKHVDPKSTKGIDVLRNSVLSEKQSFNFGHNTVKPEMQAKIDQAKLDPVIKKLSKNTSYTVKQLPIQYRKSFKGLATQLEQHQAELDALLGPGDMVAIRFRITDNKGKKRINKSMQLFSTFKELARYLQRYEMQKRYDQSELIGAMEIVKFKGEVKQETYVRQVGKERLRRAIKRNKERDEKERIEKEGKAAIKALKKAQKENEMLKAQLKKARGGK